MKKLLSLVSLFLMLALLLTSCGLTPTVEISDDGYWVINGEKTDVRAEGEKGEQGEPGIDENPQGLAFFPKDDGTYAVGIGEATYLSKIEIPATYNGRAVTEIGAFSGRALKEIVIPDSVTTIGARAFVYCESLESVTLGSGIQSIGSEAFPVTPLSSLHIKDLAAWCGITFRGAYATPSAEKLYLNGTLVTDLVIPEGVTEIGDYAFSGFTGLSTVTLPGSVTSIGSYAFRYCSDLASVVIPESVTEIGDYAFAYSAALTVYAEAAEKPAGWSDKFSFVEGYPSVVWSYRSNEVASDGCIYATIDGIRYALRQGEATVAGQPRSIKAAEIPASVTYRGLTYPVTSIGDDAFSGSSLAQVTLPGSIVSIGENAFSHCTDLTSIALPTSLETIGEYAFYNAGALTSVTLPAGVTHIGSFAFAYCRGLTSVTLPDGLESIGNYAFADCNSLASLSLPSGLKSIGEYAFYSCWELSSVTLPDGITHVRKYAFSRCTKLASIYIPDSIIFIADYAFGSCTSLTVYTEVREEPSNWGPFWNADGCPVEWGWTGE